MVDVQLTVQELTLIREALDSHIYWQLSDEHYRSDGDVREPGSDDAESAEKIAGADALLRRMRSLPQDMTSADSN